MTLATRFRWAIAAMAALFLGAVHAATSGEAFGTPGAAAMHGPAQKSFLGTALSATSQVYFTGYRGVVSEVYCPVLDTTESVDLQFLVGDAAGTFVDEEKLQPYRSVRRLRPSSTISSIRCSKRRIAAPPNTMPMVARKDSAALAASRRMRG